MLYQEIIRHININDTKNIILTLDFLIYLLYHISTKKSVAIATKEKNMLPEDNVLFKNITAEDSKRMINCFNAEIKKFRAGSCITDFSASGDKIGIILDGSAVMVRYDINGVRTIVEKLGEQSIFGEFFTFTGTNRNAVEIVAETDCDIIYFKRQEILKRCEKACKCHSMVVENLLMLMSERSIALSERIEVLSQRTIEEKLISFLQITADNTPSGQTPEIPFSTTVLSDYLCVNRSALQREISRLKKAGILKLNKRKFILHHFDDIGDSTNFTSN